MLTIGLTGGIGSGKTAASSRFAALGVPVIDTDLIAHNLTRPGQPALNMIYQLFGARVFTSDQKPRQLDRAALRTLVLEKPLLRKKLEAILHPLIERTVEQRSVAIQAPVCLLVIPLLVETGWQTRVDRVLVTETPDDSRRSWIKARSQLSDAEIAAMFASQATRQQRLDIADDIIHNDKNLPHLYRQVDKLHRQYLCS